MIAEYLQAGLVLVPIPAGLKGPEGEAAIGWNKRAKCVVHPEWTGNIGLAHSYSGTCAIDIDDIEAATRWLDARGVSLGALMDEPETVRISSGRPNRVKLIYRLPAPLLSKKIVEGKTNIIDFRCATSTGLTCQDVLPPSVHPDTGKSYVWEYADDTIGDWRFIPLIPPALLAVWQSLIEAKTAPPTEHGERVGIDELRELLKDHDPGMDRDAWVKVLAIIHYETQGSDEGLALANEWSQGSDKYKGAKDVKTRWRSFRLDRPDPATAASLRIDRVASPDDFEMIDEAIATDPEKPSRFRVIPAQEFAITKPLGWIIKSVLPKAEVVVIYGESGSGKTFMVLDMVAAISTGRTWRDHKTEQGKVVYVCAEGVGGFRQRLRAYARQFDIPLEALPGVIPDAPNFLEGKDPLEVAKQIIKSGGASVVVIDTLSAVLPGGNENAGEDMGQALAHCKGIHRATGALVILIHHSGKDASKGARGWSGLRAAADAELEVVRQGDYRKLTVTKQKDGDDSAEFGFKLLPIEIGEDEDGLPMTSCIIEHTAVAPSVKSKKPPGAMQQIVLQITQEMTPDGATTIDCDDLVAAVLKRIPADSESAYIRPRNVRRAIDGLIAGHFLQLANNRVSLCGA